MGQQICVLRLDRRRFGNGNSAGRNRLDTQLILEHEAAFARHEAAFARHEVDFAQREVNFAYLPYFLARSIIVA